LNSGTVLKPESYAKMTTPFKAGYAYGLNVRTVNGRKVINHGGAIEGFNTFMAYYPDDKLSVIVLANLNGPAPQNIARSLAAVAYGEKVLLASDAIKVPAKTLAEYAGTYRFDPKFAMVVTLEGDQLFTQATGQRKAPIYAETETIFFPTVVEAKIEFVRDAAGKVTQLVLHQGGRDMKAARE
jgi:CubicO group peptidase (beta-lactamase class C family)